MGKSKHGVSSVPQTTKPQILKKSAIYIGLVCAGAVCVGLALGGFILPAMVSARNDLVAATGVIIAITIGVLPVVFSITRFIEGARK